MCLRQQAFLAVVIIPVKETPRRIITATSSLKYPRIRRGNRTMVVGGGHGRRNYKDTNAYTGVVVCGGVAIL
jgi:hypothetical protein